LIVAFCFSLSNKYSASINSEIASKFIDYLFIALTVITVIVGLIVVTQVDKPSLPNRRSVVNTNEIQEHNENSWVRFHRRDDMFPRPAYPFMEHNHFVDGTKGKNYEKVALIDFTTATGKTRYDGVRTVLMIKNADFYIDPTFNSEEIRIYNERTKEYLFSDLTTRSEYEFIAWEGTRSGDKTFALNDLWICPHEGYSMETVEIWEFSV